MSVNIKQKVRFCERSTTIIHEKSVTSVALDSAMKTHVDRQNIEGNESETITSGPEDRNESLDNSEKEEEEEEEELEEEGYEYEEEYNDPLASNFARYDVKVNVMVLSLPLTVEHAFNCDPTLNKFIARLQLFPLYNC